MLSFRQFKQMLEESDFKLTPAVRQYGKVKTFKKGYHEIVKDSFNPPEYGYVNDRGEFMDRKAGRIYAGSHGLLRKNWKDFRPDGIGTDILHSTQLKSKK